MTSQLASVTAQLATVTNQLDSVREELAAARNSPRQGSSLATRTTAKRRPPEEETTFLLSLSSDLLVILLRTLSVYELVEVRATCVQLKSLATCDAVILDNKSIQLIDRGPPNQRKVFMKYNAREAKTSEGILTRGRLFGAGMAQIHFDGPLDDSTFLKIAALVPNVTYIWINQFEQDKRITAAGMIKLAKSCRKLKEIHGIDHLPTLEYAAAHKNLEEIEVSHQDARIVRGLPYTLSQCRKVSHLTFAGQQFNDVASSLRAFASENSGSRAKAAPVALETLDFTECNFDDIDMTDEGIKSMINSIGGSLERLCFFQNYGCDATTFPAFIETAPRLKELCIEHDGGNPALLDQICERLALTSPYPAMETLSFDGFGIFTNRTFELLPTIFPNLKDLKIATLDAAVQGDMFCRCVARLKSLKTLRTLSTDWEDSQGWDELREGCPHVTNQHLLDIEETIIAQRGGDILEGIDGCDPIYSRYRFETDSSLSDEE